MDFLVLIYVINVLLVKNIWMKKITKITKINDITWLKMQYQCNLIPQLSRVFACFEVKIYPDNYSLKVIST
jgi:hypothetical protein